MLLPPFDYHRPESLEQALALLRDLGEGTLPLAGGTDLLVNLKLKKLAPRALVDLDGLPELHENRQQDGVLALGALNTAAGLAGGNPEIPRVLALGAGALGSPQVRHRATVGGNLITARPAADICLPLLALGATAVLEGPEGRREVGLDGYFLGPGLSWPSPPPKRAGSRSTLRKLPRMLSGRPSCMPGSWPGLPELKSQRSLARGWWRRLSYWPWRTWHHEGKKVDWG